MIVERKKFFEVQKIFQDIPYNQTEEWLESLLLDEKNIIYFVDSIEKPKICYWGIIFKRPFIKRHVLINGVCVKDIISSQDIMHHYREIISSGYELIEISDIGFYDANFEVGFRRAGFIRPLGMSESPLTMIIKLQEPFVFHRNWRRNVKKSMEYDIQFKYIEVPTVNDAEIFVKLFNELKERKKIGFNITVNSLMKLFLYDRFKLFFVHDKKGNYLAGRIGYICRNKVYDVFAANSYDGIKCGAVYYLQEKIFFYLRDIGMEIFDYGHIPPGTDSLDDIYVSKSYSGGIPILYNGQWQYSNSKILEFAYCLYKYLLHKNKRY
ncbi:MAG: hypothetical protein FDX30_03055 [Chlorobium sp.]|nr:MAG: hypothetical protein FDX30_03055 [Chlorobium sp.]